MFDALRNLLSGLGGHPQGQKMQPLEPMQRMQPLPLEPSLQVHPGTGLQQTGSPDGVQPWAQGSQPNISGGYSNPQIMQGNQGLQGQFGVPDTSYSGGADAQADFPAFLANLLGRK